MLEADQTTAVGWRRNTRQIHSEDCRLSGICASRCSLLAEALFLVLANGRKETSAMGRKWLWFNRRPQSWTALLQRMLLTLFADLKLSPFRLTHYFTLIPLSFIEPTLMTRSLSRGACSIQPFSTHGRRLFSPVSDQQEKSWASASREVEMCSRARKITWFIRWSTREIKRVWCV